MRHRGFGYAQLACVIAFLGCMVSINAQEIRSFAIRVGTLEPVAQPVGSYVFRSGDDKELFDLSGAAFLRNSGVDFPRIPGLREIGVKLDNGAEYIYIESELRTYQRAARENPGHKVVTKIFEGQAKSRLEIMVTGQTPVVRVDLQIDGKSVTLWCARQADAPAK